MTTAGLLPSPHGALGLGSRCPEPTGLGHLRALGLLPFPRFSQLRFRLQAASPPTHWLNQLLFLAPALQARSNFFVNQMFLGL